MQGRPCVSVTTMVQDPSGAMNNSTICRASVDTPTACRVSPNRCFNRSASLFCGTHSTCPAAGVGHSDRAANKKAARTAALKPKGAVNIPFTCVLGSVKPRLRRSPADQPSQLGPLHAAHPWHRHIWLQKIWHLCHVLHLQIGHKCHTLSHDRTRQDFKRNTEARKKSRPGRADRHQGRQGISRQGLCWPAPHRRPAKSIAGTSKGDYETTGSGGLADAQAGISLPTEPG